MGDPGYMIFDPVLADRGLGRLRDRHRRRLGRLAGARTFWVYGTPAETAADAATAA